MRQIEKYKGLLDMINGGGANAEGDKFQGGGLLSILANALATPYGSEDRAEEAAGLLGNTRPQMRPNRPASIAPAAIPAGSAPAPSYTMPGTIAEMSDRARDRAMPLTQASDIPGGFNPASTARSYVGNLDDPLEMFFLKLNTLFPEEAQKIMSGPNLGMFLDHYRKEGEMHPAIGSSFEPPANAAPVQMQGSGMTPANNYILSSDPFSYSGDALKKDFGMAGNIPTPGRYDFVNDLPDDANDFGINPSEGALFAPIGPNPFAGMPGVGGDGRSLDGEILRYTPTGLPEVSPELGFAMPDGSSDYRAALRYPLQRFAEQLVEIGGVSPEVVQRFIQTSRGKELYTKYVNGDPFKINGKKFPNY
tara:strand:- start:1783 stop:2871 length:1089 start_codon:yes stop_codon:yes gene_type:complete